MYKIYINEKKLFLINSDKIDRVEKFGDNSLIVPYSGKSRSLYNYVDLLEKGTDYSSVVVHSAEKKILVSDFKTLLPTIHAGGGLIINELNEILFIERKGFWDLPKGKLDPGETKREGAIREVMEETGVRAVKIVKKLSKTRHSFKSKLGKRQIKKTQWYLMEAKKQNLIPETREDITQAVWMSLEEFESKPRKVYNSIVAVLEKYKKQLQNTMLSE